MKKIIIFFLSLFIFLNLYSNQVSFIWVLRQWPPYSIYEGEFPGEGYGQEYLKIIQENMPNIDFTIDTQTNFKRMMSLAGDKEEIGSQGFIKTPEREKVLYYSIPAEVHLPLRIFFVRGSSILKSENQKSVSLEYLLKNPDYVTAIEKGRSYSSGLDKLLSESKSVQRRTNTSSDGLIKMLIEERIDYLIEYPASVAYVFRNSPESIRVLYSLEIEESNNILIGHYVFSKTDFGKEFIDNVNKILQVQLKTKRYRTAAEKWLDTNSIEVYRKAYKEQLLEGL